MKYYASCMEARFSETRRKEGLRKGFFLSPTNVAPSVILEDEDYGLKPSINLPFTTIIRCVQRLVGLPFLWTMVVSDVLGIR